MSTVLRWSRKGSGGCRALWTASILAAVLLFTLTPDRPAAADTSKHLDNLLVSWDGSPNGGLFAVLGTQIKAARWQAFVATGAAQGSSAKKHLFAVINIIVGKAGKGYDSSYGDTGDGFGVLPYLAVALDEAKLAAKGTDGEKRAAGDVVIESLLRMEKWSSETVENARLGIDGRDDSAIWRHAGLAKSLLFIVEIGEDRNGDKDIEDSEGGLKRAVEKAKLMR